MEDQQNVAIVGIDVVCIYQWIRHISLLLLEVRTSNCLVLREFD